MSSPAVVDAISPTRLGFCQRCGDPISGKVRCSRCGGTSKEPRIRSTQALPAAKKPDPWAHRYVHGDSSFQSDAEHDQDEYLHNQPPPLSPKRASYDPALGFGMPSRISRDLRTSNSTKAELAVNTSSLELALGTSPANDRLSPAPTAGGADARRASQDYSAPVVQGSDGVLSKVCGSLVEPAASRNRWACADCANVFARDSTLYAAPASLPTHDGAYFCRNCYAKRYSLGECHACGRAVLGSTKEDGKYVKATAGIWHGRCWKCTACARGAKDGIEVLVGMDGKPTCETCFDRPIRRTPSAEPSSVKEDTGLPDVRRLTRIGASRSGPMGATIAELTKKLGQQTVSASPRVPFSARSGSNTSLPTSSSSHSSLDAPRSPAKNHYSFPNHVPTSPGKPAAMTRSGSLTGSPPKPRPLTAQFRDGLNLAAFQPSFGGDGERERLDRRDSRSRSVSPVKRPQWKHSSHSSAFDILKGGVAKSVSPSSSLETDRTAATKVPGSPSLGPVPSAGGRLDLPVAGEDSGRRRTSSGYPRPLNAPFSKHSETAEPIQGEKPTPAMERDALLDQGLLEPAEGTVRCAVCHLLPFERVGATDEVVMVTLSDSVHLHAECFTCSVCHAAIDGSKTFVRLQHGVAAAEGLPAYAHPHCAPTIQLSAVQSKSSYEGEGKGQRSYRSSLDPASAAVAMTRDGSSRSHATHQRELKPSPTPSPAPSVRDRSAGVRASILPATAPVDAHTSNSNGGTTESTRTSVPIRRFQPTAGAAPPTRSTILAAHTPATSARGTGANPAAGIFSRMSALSSAATTAGNPVLTLAASTSTPTAGTAVGKGARFGGMPNCAFCGEKLTSLESVLGPRGTQWHKACLVCRGAPPPAPKDVWVLYRRDAPKWCGKRLDSGAKVNRDGEVRCRDCYDRESAAFRIKT